MSSSKKGISAHQIHRMLGVTYEAAWFMCHRIRYAMTQSPLVEKLEGIVEVDETYVGGKHKGGKRGRGSESKTPVVAIVERDGKVRAKKMKHVTRQNLHEYIRGNVSSRTRIMTDGLSAYKGIKKGFKNHQVVDHSKGEYAWGDVHVNSAESWFAILKRGVYGTFHHVSEKHLNRYVNEFVFRWDNRKISDYQRTLEAIKGTVGKRLLYRPRKSE
jgi:transposase-like protein